MVPNPALNQGEALDEHPEADIADGFRRLTSAAPFVMFFHLTVNRQENIRQTSEACTVGPMPPSEEYCRVGQTFGSGKSQEGSERLFGSRRSMRGKGDGAWEDDHSNRG